MGWKEWPYWLKGGLILGIVTLVLFVSGLILEDIFIKYKISRDVLEPLAFVLFFGGLTGLLIGAVFGDLPIIILILFNFVSFFIIGAFIGWLYGKMKNKNIQTNNQRKE